MILNNLIIQKDLESIKKDKRFLSNIILYITILILLLSLFSVFEKVKIIDTTASVFLLITIFSLCALLIDGIILNIIKYLQKDFFIEEKYWKVVLANLSTVQKYKNFNKMIFNGNYEFITKNNVINYKKGERFFLVIRDLPIKDIIKQSKKVYCIYSEKDYERYDNSKHLIKNNLNTKIKITDNNIKKDIFKYNFPEIIENILFSIICSFGIGTIIQLLKQQYMPYFKNNTIYTIMLLVLVVSFILFGKLKTSKHFVLFKNSVLIEDKKNYSLVSFVNNEQILIKIYPKYKFKNFTNTLKQK